MSGGMEECGTDLDEDEGAPFVGAPIEFFPTNRFLGLEAVALPLPPMFDDSVPSVISAD